MEQMLSKTGAKRVQLLPAVNDDHGGVIVELQELMDSNVFETALRDSLAEWKLQVCSFYSASFGYRCCLNTSYFREQGGGSRLIVP